MNNHLARLNTPSLRNDLLFPFEQQFNTFFDNFFKDSPLLDGVKASNGYPKMDIISDDDFLTVKAALPGFDPKDVKVEILPDNVLKLSGDTKEEQRSGKDKYLVRELRTSQFARFVSLPDWVKDDPEALMKDGILTLTWAKPLNAEKKQKQRLIEVKKEE